jgi:predicted GNAT family acetyltransferase
MPTTHDPDHSRYVYRTEGGDVAGEVEYINQDGVLLLVKAEIWPEYQGRGLGGMLVRETLEMIRDEGHGKVQPVCPFIVKYMMKNPEFQSLTA